MDPEKLARTIEDFLLEAPDSVVLEDGEAIFDLATSRYTVTVRQGKCLLHLWSEERNALRRVFDLELRQTVLRLQVQKFGQVPSTTIEICQADDRRNDSTRKVHRSKYQRLLGRV